ncbi:peroxynitrite isomerase THAP4-like [Rhipicephalus microplus]|uniref:peroxynitrite isomerase THAP4-like n=1 Tax=Rhipicephalus microplus TaxID=6941 RepID=UPI003F6D201A
MPGCCVPQCSNHSRNGWKLYRFPRDPKRRLLWTVKIKRDKWQPTDTSHVCSAHFEENNYEQHRADGWKKLKPNAVPTLFTFKPLPKERKPPKERTVPAPSSNETNKSPPGLRQYPAAVKTAAGYCCSWTCVVPFNN